jgi:chemotaxis protein MotB
MQLRNFHQIVISLSLLVLLGSSGCVSKKRYARTVQEMERLQQENIDYYNKYLTSYVRRKKMEKDYTRVIKNHKSPSVAIQELNRKLLKQNQTYYHKYEKMESLQQQYENQRYVFSQVHASLNKTLLEYPESRFDLMEDKGSLFVIVPNNMMFMGKTSSLSEKGKEMVQHMKQIIETNADLDLVIKIHSGTKDKIDKKEYRNYYELTYDRATEVITYYIDGLGGRPDRVAAVGKGYHTPYDYRQDIKSRIGNDRVEFIFTPRREDLYEIFREEDRATGQLSKR